MENRNDKKEDKRFVPIQPSQKSLYTSAQAQQSLTDKENNPNQVPVPKTKVAVHTKLRPRLTVPRSPNLATARYNFFCKESPHHSRRQEAKFAVLAEQQQRVKNPGWNVLASVDLEEPKPVVKRYQPPRAVKLQPKASQKIQTQPKLQPAKTKSTQPKPAPKPASKSFTQTREFNFRTEKRKRNVEKQDVISKAEQKETLKVLSSTSDNGNNRNNNNRNNNNRDHNTQISKKASKPIVPQNNKRKRDPIIEKPPKKQCLRDLPKEEKPVPFKAGKIDETLLHGPVRNDRHPSNYKTASRSFFVASNATNSATITSLAN